MLAETFKKPKPILGRIRLLPLPGSPGWDGQWEALIARAEQEATALASGGVDGLIIENFHDTPYSQGRMDTAGAIAMATLTRRLHQFTDLPIGISVLRNDPETALAIALNTCASFIRIPLLSGAMMTESGVINSRLDELLRYRQHLKTELPLLMIDVSTNHLGPAPLFRSPISEKGGERLNHLIHISKTLPRKVGHFAVILPDRDIEADEITAFKEATGDEVLIENQTSARLAEAYYEKSDGLILDADTRKSTGSHPEIPPTIDMPKVEELVNHLRQVVPVSELSPDVFLRR
jgi:predicted TIM-barrel enzyme